MPPVGVEGPAAVEPPLPRVAVEPTERPPLEELGTCYATFEDVAAAWESLRGPLTAECRAVVLEYEVRLVADVPCSSASCQGSVRGQVVHIGADVSPAGQVFVSTHEWTHVLAECMEGDGNGDHSDLSLWALERDAVLGLARANPPVGPCLEAP